MRKFILLLLLSNWIINLFAQVDIPEQPHITLVTTDSITQKAIIKWEPSPSAHIAHYVLYLFKGNLAPAVDTLPATARQTEYQLSNAANQLERYALGAVDSFKKESIIDSRDKIIHQTIHLSATRDTCTGEVKLEWNNYPALTDRIKGYKLYTYQSNKWVLINNFPPTTQAFNSNDAFTGNDEFLLEAYGDNNLRIYSNHPKAPLPGKSFLQIESSLAQYTTDGCAISAKINGGNANDTLLIYRAINCNENKKEIYKEQPYTLQEINFLDKNTTAIPGQSFLLEIHNRCGKTLQSICIKPLGLFVKQENEKFNFYWTNYDKNASYNLTRIENNINQTLTTTQDTFFTYIPENITIAENEKWCFQLNATSPANSESAQSNTLCFTPDPIIFIPEVFTPDGNGKNDYFRPNFIYTQPSSYNFRVFDKFGRTVYHTTNYSDKGWDGTLLNGGKALSGDVFVCTIEYTLNNQKQFIKRGNIAIYLSK
jgi:gliding motility-associated-like protein